MQHVVIINGSYRAGGVCDQVVNVAIDALERQAMSYTLFTLREQTLHFCTNCRLCAQEKGESPGKCVLNDDLSSMVDSLEKASHYILISPTNFGTVTAVFKQFLERLMVYGYYPWGKGAPSYRKKKLDKKTLIITSCAAPSFFGFFFQTRTLLKKCARVLGAKVVASQTIGLCSKDKEYKLTAKEIYSLKRHTNTALLSS